MTSIFETPLEEAIAICKKVLPLMSQRGVPTIPQNYAVWFDYVNDTNEALKHELETLIERGGEFSPETCRTIYERYFIDDVRAEVDGIQGAVKLTVESVLRELGGLGDDIGNFSKVLEDTGLTLKSELEQDDLQKLVVNLATETRATQERSAEVEGSLTAMADELSELREQVERLSRDSQTDSLTLVANRRAFDAALEELSKEAVASDLPLSLIMVDIDHFKQFNDTHGHIVGDHVLRFVAQEMKQCLRAAICWPVMAVRSLPCCCPLPRPQAVHWWQSRYAPSSRFRSLMTKRVTALGGHHKSRCCPARTGEEQRNFYAGRRSLVRIKRRRPQPGTVAARSESTARLTG